METAWPPTAVALACAASCVRRKAPSTRGASSTAPASRNSYAAAPPCPPFSRLRARSSALSRAFASIGSILGQLGGEALQRLGLVRQLERLFQGDLALLHQLEQARIEALHPAPVVGSGVEVAVDLEDLVLADQVGEGVALQQHLHHRDAPLAGRVLGEVLRDRSEERRVGKE